MAIILKYIIFTGRFQPFHNGHFEILNQIIADWKEDCVIVLAVIAPAYGIPIDKSFSHMIDEQLQPERNPWPVIVPLLAVNKIIESLKSKGINNIVSSILPCPDKSIIRLKDWFPDERYWIIPSAGEEFDDSKSEFYIRNNEKVVRYNDTTGVNGWQLRNHYFNGEFELFSKGLPSEIVDIYWNFQ